MDTLLPTWDGRSKFKYRGTVNTGTDIHYSKDFYYKISITAAEYRRMLGAFKGLDVPCGTAREIEKRPEDSLGYWIGQNITKTAIASYLAQILIHESFAKKKDRILSFN